MQDVRSWISCTVPWEVENNSAKCWECDQSRPEIDQKWSSLGWKWSQDAILEVWRRPRGQMCSRSKIWERFLVDLGACLVPILETWRIISGVFFRILSKTDSVHLVAVLCQIWGAFWLHFWRFLETVIFLILVTPPKQNAYFCASEGWLFSSFVTSFLKQSVAYHLTVICIRFGRHLGFEDGSFSCVRRCFLLDVLCDRGAWNTNSRNRKSVDSA